MDSPKMIEVAARVLVEMTSLLQFALFNTFVIFVICAAGVLSRYIWNMRDAPYQSSNPCPECREAMDPERTWSISHHGYKELENCANKCSICRMFFSSLRSQTISGNPSSDLEINKKSGILSYRFYDYPTTYFEIFKEAGNNKIGLTTNRQKTFEQSPKFAHDGRRINPDPLSQGSLKIVRSWLNVCSSMHNACIQNKKFALPTRVIDVRGKNPRLETGKVRDISYAILSHCWGEGATLKTTEATLKSTKHPISWSTLPTVYRDAITVTRKLNIDYLWIDSLCIIQDSIEDWQRECFQMADYYKNAFITLSALESSGSEEGFLSPRDSCATQWPDLKRVWIRPKGRDAATVFRSAALNKRGWALQERLLSTRIIHFTKDEMIWECLTCSTTEKSLTEYREVVDSQSLVSSEGQDFKRALLHLDKDPFSLRNGTFALWYRLVKQFSCRSLKYESDKLPAIAGLALSLARRTGFTYVAGIWEQDLHGLLWSRDDSRVSTRLPGEAHSNGVGSDAPLPPSWSWAAISQPITYRFYEEARTYSTQDAQLRRSNTIRQGSDPYAVPLTAELVIKGVSQPVQCIPGWWHPAKHVHGFTTDIETYSPRVEWYVKAYRSGLTLNIFDAQGHQIGTGCFDDQSKESRLVHCRAICIGERVYEKIGQTPVTYFLLVVAVSEEALNPKWQRIGMGMTRDTAKMVSSSEFYPGSFEGLASEEMTLI